MVATAAELREPHRVARYLEELAGTYHRFYDACRVLPRGDEEPTDTAPGAALAGRGHPRSCSPTGCGCSASARPSGCKRYAGARPPGRAEVRRARPRGPARRSARRPRRAGPGRLAAGPDPGRRRAPRPCAATTSATWWPSTAARCSCWTRPTCAGACRDYREAFGGAMVFYAAKAFLCTAVARWVEEEGLGLDVCTGGELAVAVRAGFPGDRMLLHGNNKSDRRAGRRARRRRRPGGRRLAAPRSTGCRRLCAERGVTQPVLVRATVGVEAHTHEFIATAHEDQKFGFSLAGGDAARGGPPGAGRPGGSSWSACTPTSARRSSTPAASRSRPTGSSGCWPQVRDELGVELPELNLGGGLGIAYTSADDPADVVDMGRSLRSIVERECAGVRAGRCPRWRSSPAAASSARARSPSTRWAPSSVGRGGCGPSSPSTAG